MRNIRKYRGRSALAACTAGIVGAAFASSVHAQNLLLDPGFEGGIAGAPDASAGDVPLSAAGPWLGWNNWVPPYSGFYTTSVPAHGGTQVGKTFSGPNGGIYQFVPVTAGDTYTAAAWFVNSSSDALNGAETDDVRMIFFSGPNGTGSGLGTDVSLVPVSDLTSPDTWTQLNISAVAPAGAESVQWMAFFNNPGYGGGSLFVDDASLIDTTPTNPVWNGGGADNNWMTAGNWGGTLPASPGSALVFDGSTRLTNNNNFAANTVFSGIQFNATAGAFILGGNAVGLAGDVVNNSSSAQTVNTALSLQQNTHFNAASGDLNLAGAISGGFSVTTLGNHTVTLGSANSYSGGTTVTAGTLVIAAHGALPAASNVSITAGTLQLAANTGSETLSGISVASGGFLDLTNNHIFLSYADGTQAATDATVRGYLKNAYDGGAWIGTSGTAAGGGIGTSLSNPHYGVGYADGADGIVVGLSSGQIEIKYTLYGDADIDGSVTGSDFTALVGNLGKSGRVWDQGDFDYDGSVTGSDFTALVGNLGKSASGADVVLPAADYAAIDAFAAANGLMADVPEPASVGLIVLACLGSLGRRTRRSQ